MNTWGELQKQICEAVENHAPRKSLYRRLVLLKALAMLEEPMEQECFDQMANHADNIGRSAVNIQYLSKFIGPSDGLEFPSHQFREAEHKLSVSLALLRAVREKYETQTINLRSVMEAAE